MRIDFDKLKGLRELSSGGTQGAVYHVPNLATQFSNSLVYKEYKTAVLPTLNEQALQAMPTYIESLPAREAIELLSLVAWPCRLVEKRGKVSGFVMPAIPRDFYIDFKVASGTKNVIAEFQHLLNDTDFLDDHDLIVSDVQRYKLLSKIASALHIFHRHQLVVGDFSPKNMLFSLMNDCNVYFIDADSMCFKRKSVLEQLETPDWQITELNPKEELATIYTDAYKLGLMALRLFVGDSFTRNVNKLPSSVPKAVKELMMCSLSVNPLARPLPKEWIVELERAASSATIARPSAKPRVHRAHGQAHPATFFTAPAQKIPARKVAAKPNQQKPAAKRVIFATACASLLGLYFYSINARTPVKPVPSSVSSIPVRTAPPGPANAILTNPPTAEKQRNQAVDISPTTQASLPPTSAKAPNISKISCLLPTGDTSMLSLEDCRARAGLVFE